MTNAVLGLDIGGANLKASDDQGRAQSVPFALWKQPRALAPRLNELLARYPEAETLAITMTGELCDCFATLRAGVEHILRAAWEVAGRRRILVWSNQGDFLSLDQSFQRPREVAAANWLATATHCASWFESSQDNLLIDVGSTTTDIIPICGNRPVPLGRTDTDRLASSELLYRGTRRTPISALASALSFRGQRVNIAAEAFATTLDVYLLLGQTPEDSACSDTADGQPATRAAAHARLARMLCADRELLTLEESTELARQLDSLLRRDLREAIWRVRARSLAGRTVRCILAGSGEFLARTTLAEAGFEVVETISVADRLGSEVSAAACAYAVAQLATQRDALSWAKCSGA